MSYCLCISVVWELRKKDHPKKNSSWEINVILRRITVNEALAHEYLHQYYDPEDEPVSEQPFRFDEEFDNYNRERLRNMIFTATDPSHFRQADRMEQ